MTVASVRVRNPHCSTEKKLDRASVRLLNDREEAMAKLTAEAARGSSAAADGTPVTLCVSVTDEEGKPVAGLSKQAFKLTVLNTPMVGGELGGDLYIPISIVSVGGGGVLEPGFYHVGIKPVAPYHWQGRIILGLAVEMKNARGQTTAARGQTIVAL